MAFDTLHVKSVEGLLNFKKPSDTHLVHEKLFSFNVTFVKSKALTSISLKFLTQFVGVIS